MEYVEHSLAKVPVFCDADVCVLGAGAAGSIAAIAAARQGAETVLVERTAALGGVATTDFMGNMNNRFITYHGQEILGGITREVMDRLVAEGGTHFPDVATTLNGNLDHPPQNVQFMPEVLSYVLLTMAREAGVKMMFHTHFSHALGSAPRPEGIVVVNKSGPQAIRAKSLVDTSGDADLAAATGAPCRTPDTSWGLLMRVGNVDFDGVMDLVSKLTPWEPWPEFGRWLSSYLGQPLEEIERSGYWSKILDPVKYDHVAKKTASDREFSTEKLEWIKNRWQKAGIFYNFELPLIRHLLKEACEAGDLPLVKRVEGFGELRLNWDGFAIGAWGPGVALVNSCHAMTGFDGTDGAHVSKAEEEGRIYCMQIARFLKKYVAGFADSFLLDMGWQFVPRSARMIEGEYEFQSQSDLQGEGKRFPDAVFITCRGGETFSKIHQIPYRVLVPKLVDNVWVAGKCASSARFFRSIAACMAMGEAAGVAAHLSARTGSSNRGLDVGLLQDTLKKQGVLLETGDSD